MRKFESPMEAKPAWEINWFLKKTLCRTKEISTFLAVLLKLFSSGKERCHSTDAL